MPYFQSSPARGSVLVGLYAAGGSLVDVPDFLLHVVHQQILAESVGRGEIGFAAAELRPLLDEVHQAVVRGEHEGVDQNAVATAARDFVEGFGNHERIEPESVLVDPAVIER